MKSFLSYDTKYLSPVEKECTLKKSDRLLWKKAIASGAL